MAADPPLWTTVLPTLLLGACYGAMWTQRVTIPTLNRALMKMGPAVFLALTAFFRAPEMNSYSMLVSSGLMISAFGDGFLEYAPHGVHYFLKGLLCFLVGH